MRSPASSSLLHRFAIILIVQCWLIHWVIGSNGNYNSNKNKKGFPPPPPPPSSSSSSTGTSSSKSAAATTTDFYAAYTKDNPEDNDPFAPPPPRPPPGAASSSDFDYYPPETTSNFEAAATDAESMATAEDPIPPSSMNQDDGYYYQDTTYANTMDETDDDDDAQQQQQQRRPPPTPFNDNTRRPPPSLDGNRNNSRRPDFDGRRRPPPQQQQQPSSSSSSSIGLNQPIDYKFPASTTATSADDSDHDETDIYSESGRRERQQPQPQFASPRRDIVATYMSTKTGTFKVYTTSSVVGAYIGYYLAKSILPFPVTPMSILSAIACFLFTALRTPLGELMRAISLSLLLVLQRTSKIRKRYPTWRHVPGCITGRRSRDRNSRFPPRTDNPWRYKPRSRDDVDFNMMYSMIAMAFVGSTCGGNIPLVPTWLGAIVGAGILSLGCMVPNPRGDLCRTLGMRVVALLTELWEIQAQLKLIPKAAVVSGQFIDRVMILDRKHRVKDRFLQFVSASYNRVMEMTSTTGEGSDERSQRRRRREQQQETNEDGDFPPQRRRRSPPGFRRGDDDGVEEDLRRRPPRRRGDYPDGIDDDLRRPGGDRPRRPMDDDRGRRDLDRSFADIPDGPESGDSSSKKGRLGRFFGK